VSRRRAGFVLAWAALALCAGAAAAAELDLTLREAASGREVAARRVELRPGEETRLERSAVRLPGRATPVDLVLVVSLEDEDRDGVTVAIHGMVRAPGTTRPLSWMARTFTLHGGEEAGFTVSLEAGVPGIEFATRNRPAPPVVSDAATGVDLTTWVRLRQEGGGEGRILEERRVRLSGPAATEVRLSLPGEQGALLVLHLVPVSRDRKGAVIGLAIETRGIGDELRSRETTVDLGWDDRIEIEGLRSPAGRMLVEIRPQR
jgi:hypothetical protein